MRKLRLLTKTKIETIIKDWIESKDNVRKTTKLTYIKIITNKIYPYFKCYELNQKNIDLFLKKLSQDFENNLISYKYTCDIISIFKSIINFINLKFEVNFSYYITIRKKTFNNIKILMKKDQKTIIKTCMNDNTNKNLGILLALFCGLRIGEICALQWKDINFCKQTIIINKTLQRVFDINKSYIQITEPKTLSSIREIPINKLLINILKKLVKENDCFILTGKNKPLEPRNYRRYYYNFTKKLNISNHKFHNLRHTFATSCIEAGIDYKTVSELLGHSSINITMNTYVHISLDYKRKCLDKLTKYIE